MLVRRLPGSRWLLATLLCGTCLAACTRPAASTADEAAPPACCQSRYPAAALPQYSAAQLGREYQRLKRRNCAACQRYGSDLQKIMNELGTQLNGQPRAAIERAMGRPDETAAGEIIYHWRYQHDFLRFRFAADGAAVSSWYYALE